MREIVSVENLTKKIRKNVLFENLCFNISSGEVVGLLGHNGAGKSTIHKIIANRENADSGNVRIAGEDKSFETYNPNVILIPDKIMMIPNISIVDNFELLTKNYNVDRTFFEKYIGVINLELDRVINSLSKGNQELVQIIILLSINVDLYLLDEPFSGVDIFRRDLIQKIIIDVSLRNPNAAMIMTSHLINEIEKTLTRVLYLDQGHIVINKNIEDITEEHQSLFEYLKDFFGESVGYNNV
ncbi:ABC transporter ATP-binding protein [Mollicutes bacterium LVI A0039]|nr:ABC transporter ATP-binding protein [Mollicutes bacterium LVI A0039]